MSGLLNKSDIKYDPDDPLDLLTIDKGKDKGEDKEEDKGEIDLLDFKAPAQQFSLQILNSPNIKLPLTIGIYGEWGSGKTSFLKCIQQTCKNAGLPTVWFNAWKYENETSPSIPLLVELARSLETNSIQKFSIILSRIPFLSEVISESSRDKISQRLVPLLSLMPFFNEISSSIGNVSFQKPFLIPLLEELEISICGIKIKNIGKALYSFAKKRTNIEEQFSEHITKALSNINKKRMVIFIDDLDRCSPENAVKMLEDIKVLFTLRGTPCIFIIALDRRAMQGYIAQKYGWNAQNSPANAEEYMEKILTTHYNLPAVTQENVKKFVEKFLKKYTNVSVEGPHWDMVIKCCSETIASVNLTNPRKLRKILFRFLTYLTHSSWWHRLIKTATDEIRQMRNNEFVNRHSEIFKNPILPIESNLFHLSSPNDPSAHKEIYDYIVRISKGYLELIVLFIALAEVDAAFYHHIPQWCERAENDVIRCRNFKDYQDNLSGLPRRICERINPKLGIKKEPHGGNEDEVKAGRLMKDILPFVAELYQP